MTRNRFTYITRKPCIMETILLIICILAIMMVLALLPYIQPEPEVTKWTLK